MPKQTGKKPLDYQLLSLFQSCMLTFKTGAQLTASRDTPWQLSSAFPFMLDQHFYILPLSGLVNHRPPPELPDGQSNAQQISNRSDPPHLGHLIKTTA